jgi:hypothetical protein
LCERAGVGAKAFFDEFLQFPVMFFHAQKRLRVVRLDDQLNETGRQNQLHHVAVRHFGTACPTCPLRGGTELEHPIGKPVCDGVECNVFVIGGSVDTHTQC